MTGFPSITILRERQLRQGHNPTVTSHLGFWWTIRSKEAVMEEKRNPKKSSSSLTEGFPFHFFFCFVVLFCFVFCGCCCCCCCFSNIYQGIFMGQLNSDSLYKWHLNAGKQLTNKRATDKLKLMGPLIPSIWAMWLSRYYTLPKEQTITMNTEVTMGSYFQKL